MARVEKGLAIEIDPESESQPASKTLRAAMVV
jgi:hypothetical protein